MAQEVAHVDGGGVEREVLLCLPGALDPINVTGRTLTQEHRHFLPQLNEAAIAFEQFLADIFVGARLDQLSDSFPQTLDGQSKVVLDKIRTANPQFSPPSLGDSWGFVGARF